MFPYKFTVGEVAIIIQPQSPYDGQECTVTAPLHWDTGFSLQTHRIESGFMYGIRIPGVFFNFLARPWELRKKKPPAETETTTRAIEEEV